jgi:hypothetical protein
VSITIVVDTIAVYNGCTHRDWVRSVVEIVRRKYVGQCAVVCKVMAQMCAVKLVPSNVEVRVMKTSVRVDEDVGPKMKGVKAGKNDSAQDLGTQVTVMRLRQEVQSLLERVEEISLLINKLQM